jgi:hypothetical protein
MRPTAKTADDSSQSDSAAVSGKLLIVGILIVGIAAAASSWWFRYNATHRAAEFWGTGSAILIRDAPQVMLIIVPSDAARGLASNTGASQARSVRREFDVSQSHGLTHLRNALLEDHNFVWPARDQVQIAVDGPLDWKWILEFRDPEKGNLAAVQLTKDCTFAARVMSSKERGSVRPTAIRTYSVMAKGLREMFAEFTAATSADSGAKPQAANEAAEPAR